MDSNNPEQYYRAYNEDPTIRRDVEPAEFKDLFRFADKIDIVLIVVGSLFSIGAGTALILYAQPLGELVNAFASNRTNSEQMVEAALNAVKWFGLNSLGVFFATWFMSTAWTITSERQMIKARQAYLSSLLDQEVAWHDRNRPAEICSRMYLQIAKVHKALVNNFTSILTKVSMGVSGIILALVKGWQMALVMIAFLPLMIVAGYFSSAFYKKLQRYQQKNKAKDDSEVVEVFDNIRTVRMLDGEKYQTERFEKTLDKSRQKNMKHGIKNKISFAVFFFFILVNYTLGFWFGAKIISDQALDPNTPNTYTVGDIIVIFFAIYMGNLSISALPEFVTSFSVSLIEMRKISNIVDRKTRVLEGTDKAPENIEVIRFENVLFQYDSPLYRNFNLTIRKGITAFIGPSGGGKTTIINLIMRFYDIFQGRICFEGGGNQYDINNFTFESLRQRVGYVGQQPVLIGKTIREVLNAQGIDDDDLIAYLKYAQAWNFVRDIGLDSEYAMVSGGQKQRLAIARALIKKPQILILDEGTSALDRKTEQLVLRSIKELKIPFVLMIAHRMQTITNADHIINLEKGKITDQGTYNELVEKGLLQQLEIIKKKSQLEENMEERQEGLQIDKEKKKLQNVMKIIEEEQKQEGENNAQKQEEQQDEKKQFHLKYIWMLMKFNSEYWYLHLFAILGSMYIGCIFPIFAYLLSQIIDILSEIEEQVRVNGSTANLEDYQQQAMSLSMSMLVISIMGFIISALRGVGFTFLTEKLGWMLKKNAFEKSINKQMVEIDEYGAQNYSHIITTNCDDLKSLGGHYLGDITQNIITVFVGLLIAVVFNWKITLISLAIFPLIILAGKLQMSFNQGMQANTDKSHKQTHQLVIQSILNIKTVKSLHLKGKIMEKYSQSLDKALTMAIKYGNLGGIMFGIGQSLISCLLALIFFIGSILIREGQGDVLAIFTAIFAVMFAGVQTGGNLMFLAKLGASKSAACNYFQVIENIGNQNQPQAYMVQHNIPPSNIEEENAFPRLKGDIKLHDIQFKYESRDTPIFKNLFLEIKRGSKVALVGQSGSGKSTITNLIYKIYQPVSGEILIDNLDINKYSLSHLRRQIAIVSQEPVLFNRSVFENIKYNTSDATFQDVVEASRLAKAFDFITEGNFGISGPSNGTKMDEESSVTEKQSNHEIEGKAKEKDEITIEEFKKSVGTRGSYLSGGQKQRIAIARALIRKPSVLILDEATSALDNENERFVKESFEQLNATQVIIAHRLSTVQKCDKIVVMKKGKIVEEGKYYELLERQGYFYQLVNAGKE